MNELLKKSYKMGYEAYLRLPRAPCLNVEFMNIVPNCKFEDEEGVKLRIKMYKKYIKGWTDALLQCPITK